ncbi:MAG: CDP-alcohol phosphatidyltransferase family protein [Desulfobacterales bacterium]
MRAALASAALGLLAAGGGAIALLADAGASLRWAGGSAAAMAVFLWKAERLLAAERGRTPAPRGLRLGPATGLTLGRGLLVCGLGGFLLPGQPDETAAAALAWGPGVLFGLASLLDSADGALARRRGEVSERGAALDTEADAWGILLAALVLVLGGKVHPLYAATGIGFYVLRFAVRLRAARGLPVRPVRPRPAARFTAGCTMAFSAAALLPLFGPGALIPASLAVTAVFLAGMATDWLVVTGCADGEGRWEGPTLGRVQRLAHTVTPLLARLALAASAAAACASPCAGGAGAERLAAALLALPGALGLAARAAAMVLGVLAARLDAAGCTAFAPVAAAAVSLLLLGAGRWRIAQPEDRWLLRGRP